MIGVPVFDRSRLPDAADFYQQEGMTLLGRGTWRRTLCVFHDDHDPSLHINVESGHWSCKACGAKGSMIDFVMRRKGLEFREACEALGVWVAGGRKPRPSRRDLALAAIVVVAKAVITRGHADWQSFPVLLEAVHRIQSAARNPAPTELDVLTIFIVIRDLLRGFRVCERDWKALTDAVGRIESRVNKEQS